MLLPDSMKKEYEQSSVLLFVFRQVLSLRVILSRVRPRVHLRFARCFFVRVILSVVEIRA